MCVFVTAKQLTPSIAAGGELDYAHCPRCMCWVWVYWMFGHYQAHNSIFSTSQQQNMFSAHIAFSFPRSRFFVVFQHKCMCSYVCTCVMYLCWKTGCAPFRVGIAMRGRVQLVSVSNPRKFIYLFSSPFAFIGIRVGGEWVFGFVSVRHFLVGNWSIFDNVLESFPMFHIYVWCMANSAKKQYFLRIQTSSEILKKHFMHSERSCILVVDTTCLQHVILQYFGTPLGNKC